MAPPGAAIVARVRVSNRATLLGILAAPRCKASGSRHLGVGQDAQQRRPAGDAYPRYDGGTRRGDTFPGPEDELERWIAEVLEQPRQQPPSPPSASRRACRARRQVPAAPPERAPPAARSCTARFTLGSKAFTGDLPRFSGGGIYDAGPGGPLRVQSEPASSDSSR